MAPSGRDDWHGQPITGKRSSGALVYQQMPPGFAGENGAPSIPARRHAEVGDTLVVHFRNNAEKLGQALTMHPHGVKYTPDYDGVYLGDAHARRWLRRARRGVHLHVGGDAGLRRRVAVPRPRSEPHAEHVPRAFGAIIVRERGAKAPTSSRCCSLHPLLPPVTGLPRAFQAINGRDFAGNTRRSGRASARRRNPRDRDGRRVPHFHIHGHRWSDRRRHVHRHARGGPEADDHRRFTEDNPGRWLYHCHVASHQDAGMAGWYLVSP